MTAYDDWIDEQNQSAKAEYEAELRKQFEPELYEEFARGVLEGRDHLYDDVIEQFTSERLQSYYRSHPDVAEAALQALREARMLANSSPSASLVFAVTAVDVGLRKTLLEPILHGLANLDSTGALLATLIPREHSDTFGKVLTGVLKEVGKLDLRAFKRPGCKQTLWEEIADVRRLRHGVVHNAAAVSASDSERAIEIASVVLESVFVDVISALGLETDANLRITV